MPDNRMDVSEDETSSKANTDSSKNKSHNPPAAFRFHEKAKGRGVVLSNDGQTAERTQGFCIEGVAISHDAMETNCLYQVKVDKTETYFNSAYIYLGVVTDSPETVELPRWPQHPKSAVVVYYDWVMVNGNKSPSSVGSSLRDMKEGSHVGLVLDHSRVLHLYKDGVHQGAVAPDIPHPCFFMVDVGYCCKKVTALPVRPM